MPFSSPVQTIKVNSNNFEHHLILLRHVEQKLLCIKHYLKKYGINYVIRE